MVGKLQLKRKQYTASGWAALYSKITLKKEQIHLASMFHVSSATIENS